MIAIMVMTLSACGEADDEPDEVITETGPAISDQPCLRPGRAPGHVVGRAENYSGAVEDVSRIDCSPASRNSEIREGSVINTEEPPAAILFSLTEPMLWCDARSLSQLQVFPNEDYVIEWFGGTGTTWCGKSPAGRDQEYKVGNRIVLQVSDPIFGVVLDGERTIIKMLDGRATVILDGDQRSEVSAGKQLVVTEARELTSEDLSLTTDDKEAIALLREVVPLPDLTIEDLDFIAGDGRCEIIYSLRNGGKADAGDSVTRLEIDGEVSEESTKGVGAGDEVEGSIAVEISCPFLPDLSGTLIADVENTVAETEEGNNQDEILVLG